MVCRNYCKTLIDKFPNMYALILSNVQDEPVEIAGVRLRAMPDGRKRTLCPATDRLVYNDDKQYFEKETH